MEGVKKFGKLNNLEIHTICAMTDGKHIDMYEGCYQPDVILCLMKNPQGQSHWCVVRDRAALSRLISANMSKTKRARHVCTLCHRTSFSCKEALEVHEKYCMDHEAQITKLPSNVGVGLSSFCTSSLTGVVSFSGVFGLGAGTNLNLALLGSGSLFPKIRYPTPRAPSPPITSQNNLFHLIPLDA